MMNEAQLERFVKEFHVDPVSGCWMAGRASECLIWVAAFRAMPLK